MKFQDLTGCEFGKLTVLYRDFSKKKTHWFCSCGCDSGIIKSYRAGDLKYGSCQSCGCLAKTLSSERLIKHGLSRTKDYRLWKSIKGRCYNVNNKGYKNYGGRGIKMFDEWINNSSIFIEYVKSLENYRKDGHTLDRINNSKDYEPGNLRWATWNQQARNRRNNNTNILEVRKIRELAKDYSIAEISKI